MTGKTYTYGPEIIIITLVNYFEDYNLGKKISQEPVRENIVLSTKHGFDMDGFQSYDVELKQE